MTRRDANDDERDVRARFDTAGAAAGDVAAAAASGDEEEFGAAWAAFRQVAGQVDPQVVLNTPHLPEDAGEYADALAEMLERIPDGWGRWIGCGRGWYPLIVALHEQIKALLPDYEINQVKEKFGGLRFYWEADDGTIYEDGAIDPDLERRIELVEELVRAAERRAAKTCERCGAAGRLHCTRAPSPWYQTLCAACAEERGYMPAEEWREWRYDTEGASD